VFGRCIGFEVLHGELSAEGCYVARL